MDLKIYDIILGPLVTEKAYELNKELKKLVLKVHPHANKPMVQDALEKLFGVKVKNVNIAVRKGKNRHIGRRFINGSRSKTKIAYVTLAEGHSLDLLGQAGAVWQDKENKVKSS